MSDNKQKDHVTKGFLLGATSLAAMLTLVLAFSDSDAKDVQMVVETEATRMLPEIGPQSHYVRKAIRDVHGNSFVCDDFTKASRDKFCNEFEPGTSVVANVRQTTEQPWTIKKVIQVLEP